MSAFGVPFHPVELPRELDPVILYGTYRHASWYFLVDIVAVVLVMLVLFDFGVNPPDYKLPD